MLLSIESQWVAVNMIHGFPASFGKGQHQRLLLAKKGENKAGNLSLGGNQMCVFHFMFIQQLETIQKMNQVKLLCLGGLKIVTAFDKHEKLYPVSI